MSNPLFQQIGNKSNPNSLRQQFQQFKSTFQGDPRAQVQQLLDSGRMTQSQFDQLSKMASQLQSLLR